MFRVWGKKFRRRQNKIKIRDNFRAGMQARAGRPGSSPTSSSFDNLSLSPLLAPHQYPSVASHIHSSAPINKTVLRAACFCLFSVALFLSHSLSVVWRSSLSVSVRPAGRSYPLLLRREETINQSLGCFFVADWPNTGIMKAAASSSTEQQQQQQDCKSEQTTRR